MKRIEFNYKEKEIYCMKINIFLIFVLYVFNVHWKLILKLSNKIAPRNTLNIIIITSYYYNNKEDILK